jgi:hypothetical protein
MRNLAAVALACALLRDLQQVLLIGDVERAGALVETLAGRDPVLAGQLREMPAAYRFHELETALGRVLPA